MAEHLRQSPPWDRLEPRLRAMTRMLVRRHRRLITRVAKALLARTTLTAEELDRLVGRSVDEVKSNYAGRYRLLALVTAGSSSAAEAYAIQLVHTSSNPPSVSAQMPRPRIASE